MTRYLLLAARLVLGAVFLYGAWTKLSQPWLLFAMSIDSYRILPEWAVLLVARTLPWFELFLGLMLIAGWQLFWWAAISTALLAAFLAMILRAWAKGMGIDCGCFGFGEAISWKTLLRDGGLLALSAFITLAAWRRGLTSRWRADRAASG